MARQPEARLVAHVLLRLTENVGGYFVKIHGSPYQRAGLPDILGCVEGLFFGLEVKLPGEKPTPLQEYEMKAIRTLGKGHAAVVTSPEQAVSLVKHALARAHKRSK